MQFQRYAIYYTAPLGDLADFGAAWLGWDIATGLPVAHAKVQGVTANISEITETPRKYGFHGTIKPPFRLAEGTTADGLLQAATEVCETLPAVQLEGLELSLLGRFLALTPKGDASALAQLAASVVKHLDMFRAPPTEQELAKRRKANLSPAQEQNLLDWGYPYVMNEFRFHLTLTGQLPRADASTLKAALAPALVNILQPPFSVKDFTLAGEAPDGRFHEISRIPLKG